MSNIENTVITTGKVRLSYAHLVEPWAAEEGQKKRYSASLIIPKSDTKTIQRIKGAIVAAIQKGIESKWGGKKPVSLKLPLRDGDEEREDEAYKDSFFVNANCDQRPAVVDKKKRPYATIEDQEVDVYSGCYVYANISFYPFNSNGNKGIACGLNCLMKAANGDALSSRVSVDTAFADIEVVEATDTDEVPTDDYSDLLGF